MATEVKITLDGTPIQVAAQKKLINRLAKASPAHRAILLELSENIRALDALIANKDTLLQMLGQ